MSSEQSDNGSSHFLVRVELARAVDGLRTAGIDDRQWADLLEAVAAQAVRQVGRMVANRGRGDWRRPCDGERLVSHATLTLRKLIDRLGLGPVPSAAEAAILDQAADLANMAMILAAKRRHIGTLEDFQQRAGLIDKTPTQPPPSRL